MGSLLVLPTKSTKRLKLKLASLTDEEKEALFMEFQQRLDASPAPKVAKVEGNGPSQVRAIPPSLFNGKRGSFAYFAGKLGIC